MDVAKPTILAWDDAERDREVGIPEKYIKLIECKFELLWERDVLKDPSRASRVVGVLSKADRPITVIYNHPGWFPRLRLFVTLSAGLDHLDLQSLVQRNIRIASISSFTDSVAEMTLALLLCCSRDIPRLTRSVQDPTHSQSRLSWDSPGIFGSSVGFVGFGTIGQRTAELLKPHHCNILYYDPLRSDGMHVDNVKGATQYFCLEDMLKTSDSVIIACSLTEQTIGLIGDKELKCMKPSAFLINVARGKVVNTDALTMALKSGEITGAGLDVSDPNWLPIDHPLMTMDNVILTPHCAASANYAMDKAFRCVIENVLVGLTGTEMPNELQVDSLLK